MVKKARFLYGLLHCEVLDDYRYFNDILCVSTDKEAIVNSLLDVHLIDCEITELIIYNNTTGEPEAQLGFSKSECYFLRDLRESREDKHKLILSRFEELESIVERGLKMMEETLLEHQEVFKRLKDK